ncbi:MAG: glycosyltransferase, partial [Planctomycetes bacterium]|nr:glycosyltransferase [Planctomycetota bacterium]
MDKRQKPHILFVTEKWCDCNPEHGITSSEDNLWGPLEVSGLATYDLFHFDEYYSIHKRSGDEALLNICIESKPDLVILAWMLVPKRYCNPEHETLYKIRNHLKIPIAAMWFDSVSPKIMAVSEELLPFVDLSVVADSTTAYLEKTVMPENYLSMPHPKDPRVYYDGGFDRDIDVSFAGSVEQYPDRCIALDWLRNNGIDVYKTGGQREQKLSTQEYAQTYMRSKITLNFSRHGDSFQFKGRVFESILCGAMLLEEENPETTKWFEPMLEYVPFKNNHDLLDRIRYYLEHDSERDEIARRGLEKANERYTGRIYWETILKRFGLLQNHTIGESCATYRQANQKMLADNADHLQIVGQQSKQQVKSTCATVAGRKKRVLYETPRHTMLFQQTGNNNPCYQLENSDEINTQRSVTAELFAAGNYAAVAMTDNPDEWQTYAAMGLVGKPQEAIEGLSRFDHSEARFYLGVTHWIDGDEITAASILQKIPTQHAQNLLALIRKPQIQVLSQLPTREYFLSESIEDRKFQVRNLGFFPQDLPNEPHANIHKFYDPHNPPDFYICQVVEWHQIPPNIQELPCPILGTTADYDMHIQAVYPWLQVFDELTVPCPLWQRLLDKLVQVPASTFPKTYSVPASLPPVPTGPRNVDVIMSGTVLHPCHPDKAQLLHQILSKLDIKSLVMNKHVNISTYINFLGSSKVCYTYTRSTAGMPTRALDALSMGCAAVVQKGSVLGLYLGEEHGVLTYELEANNLASTVRHILDHWSEFEQRARQGAEIVRREFALPRVTSQYLRFLTFLAAKPRGQRQTQPTEHLVQKRSVFRKGYFPPPGSNKD